MSTMVRQARGEAGETMAELIVTIAVVGLAVAAIVGALATGISASSTHRQRASADTVARSVAEAIKDRKVPLDPNGSYAASIWTGPPPPSIPIVDTTGYNVGISALCLKSTDVNSTAITSANFAACSASTTGLQSITVTVTSTGGKAEQESVTVLKRAT